MFFPCVLVTTPSDTSSVTNVDMTLFRFVYVTCLSGIPCIIVQDLSIGSAPQTLDIPSIFKSPPV